VKFNGSDLYYEEVSLLVDGTCDTAGNISTGAAKADIRFEVAVKLGMINIESLSDHAKDWISKGYEVYQYLDSKVYKCDEWISLQDAIKYGYITYDQLGEDSKKHLDDAEYNYETGHISWLA